MNKVKTFEEMERLNAIFAEVEAEEKRQFEEDSKNFKYQQFQCDEKKRVANNDRLAQQNPSQVAGNVRQMLKDHSLTTRWEIVLANAYLSLYEDKVSVAKKDRKDYAEIRNELEIHRNIVASISRRLENAEKSATEQNNHHYYKMFADAVKTLLEKI